jgi:hypothetical protein
MNSLKETPSFTPTCWKPLFMKRTTFFLVSTPKPPTTATPCVCRPCFSGGFRSTRPSPFHWTSSKTTPRTPSAARSASAGSCGISEEKTFTPSRALLREKMAQGRLIEFLSEADDALFAPLALSPTALERRVQERIDLMRRVEGEAPPFAGSGRPPVTPRPGAPKRIGPSPLWIRARWRLCTLF